MLRVSSGYLCKTGHSRHLEDQGMGPLCQLGQLLEVLEVGGTEGIWLRP